MVKHPGLQSMNGAGVSRGNMNDMSTQAFAKAKLVTKQGMPHDACMR